MYRRRTYKRKPKSVRRSIRRTRRPLVRRRYKRKLFNKRRVGFLGPDATWVKLKYYKRFSMGASDPSYANGDVYCGTNIYDPEYAVGGNQPTGFDQYMAMYRQWYCPGSKIKMTVFNANAAPADFTLWPSLSPLSGIPAYDPREQKFAKTLYLPGNPSPFPRVIKHYMTYARLSGTSGQASDPAFFGSDTVGPSLDFYWNCRGKAVTATATSIYVDIEVVYYVKFFSRRNISES